MVEETVLKNNRVNLSLTNRQDSNLKRLAISINMKPSSLAVSLLDRGMYDKKMIKELEQERHIYSTQMIVSKGGGNKKINRVNLSLTDKQFMNLKRLSIKLNIRHTKLAALIIEKCLSNVQLINDLQNEYCTQKAYRIVPINKNGELTFTLIGRDDL
ncbi:hypothetical protein [Bacillus salipaludis]|uniref:Uncharacterized protein n=1 Tax=Bacillus salipaludis TaxID=2547811 RepID=A0AA90ZAB6_9BACI|nr:hypothetical protein [Bacillus salipaludis]MDQ6600910.1 hypothetical protein [Bacillus salipaludis]